jgi:hypothetical protein
MIFPENIPRLEIVMIVKKELQEFEEVEHIIVVKEEILVKSRKVSEDPLEEQRTYGGGRSEAASQAARKRRLVPWRFLPPSDFDAPSRL